MYLGVCTPTEAAGIGTLGLAISCALRKRLGWERIKRASKGAFLVSVMCMWIIFGGYCFGRAYSVAGASDLITNLVIGLDVAPLAVICAMMGIL